jgi:hypothetical protein
MANQFESNVIHSLPWLNSIFLMLRSKNGTIDVTRVLEHFQYKPLEDTKHIDIVR